MFKLLSERMDPKPIPNVLVTDQASEKFRNQICHTIYRLFNNPNLNFHSNDVAESICSEFMFLKGGPHYDSPHHDFVEIIDEALQKLPPEDLFDFIDIICFKVSEDPYFMCFYDEFEEDINDVLRSNSIGYKLVEGMLVPFTEEVEAEELIVPAFRILNRHKLNAASEYLSRSFDYLEDGNYEEAVTSAFKAFESVLESVLTKCGIAFDKKDTTARKIDLLTSNGLYPSYLESSAQALNNLLKSPNSVRNNESGHGSSEAKDIEVCMVQYEIDMVTSSILFLVRLHFESQR